MAASANTVRVMFLGDTSGLARAAREAQAQVGSVGKGIGKMKVAAVAGFAAAGAAMVSSVSKAVQFDKTIRLVGANANLAGAQLKEMSNLALKMGADTVFSANEAADAMLELSKGGITPAEMKAGVLKQTLTLAAAGGLGLGAAAVYMSNALHTFGLEAKDAGDVAAALAGGANASTASVESLGQALSQVGPGARNAGLELEETVAVLAAFDDAGVKGSDAGTSLKTMLNRLVPPTKKAQKEFDNLGISFVNADGSFKNITEIAQILQDELGGLSEAEKTTRLQTMFGSDAQRAATILMNQGAKGIAKYIKATNDKAAAEKMAKANTEGAAGAIEAFKGSIETLQIQFALHFLPMLTQVLKALANVVNFVGSKVDPAFDALGKMFGPLASKVGKFFGALTGKNDDVSALGKALGKSGDQAKTFVDRGRAINQWIRKDFLPAVEDFKGGLKDIKDKFAKAFKDIDLAAIGTKFAEDAKNWAGDVIGGLKKGIETGNFTDLGKSLGEGLGKAIKAISIGTLNLTDKFIELMKSIDWFKVGKASVTGVVGFVLGFISSLLDPSVWIGIIRKYWKPLLLIIVTLGTEGIGGAVLKLAGKLKSMGFIGKVIAALLTGAVAASQKLLGWGLRLIGAFFRGVGTGISHFFPTSVSRFAAAVGGLVSRIAGFAGRFAMVGAVWVNSLLRALGRLPLQLGNLIGRITGLLIGGVARAIPAVAAAGGRLISGLWSGIAARAPAVLSLVRGLPARILSTLSSIGSTLLGAGTRLISGLVSGITSSIPRVLSTLRALPGRMVSAVGNLSRVLFAAGAALVTGLISGITSKLGALKNKIGELASAVKNGVKGRLGINSPSKVTTEYGRNIGQGLQLGMSQQARKVAAGAAKMADQVKGELSLPDTTAAGLAFATRSPSLVSPTGQVAARGGPDAGHVQVSIDLRGGDDEMLRWLRKRIRVNGGLVATLGA